MTTKNNTTFGFQLNGRPNRFGYYDVLLRITCNRKTNRTKTGLEVKKADWNQKAKNYNHFRSSTDDYKQKNQMLSDIIANYKEKYADLQADGIATNENVIESVKSGYVSESFLHYAKETTQSIYDAGGIRNWKKYNGFVNKLEGYLKKHRKKDLLFCELTFAFMQRFDRYLHTLPNERNPEQRLHQNTIVVNLNIFKTIVNNAIRADLMKPEDNPFLKFKYRGKKTTKEKLTMAEIDRIQALDLPDGSLIWHCRNMFLFSFYCAGVRVGDLLQLRWCNITSDRRLNYQMGKNHKVRDLELVYGALSILKYYDKPDKKPADYIFPLLDCKAPWAKYVKQEDKDRMQPDMIRLMFQTISAKTALLNKELAKIQKMAGIDTKISTHIARHSFAKAAKEKGLDNLKVQSLLAHSNINTTQKYMGEFETSANDAALEKVFEKDDEEALMNQLRRINPELLKRVLAER